MSRRISATASERILRWSVLLADDQAASRRAFGGLDALQMLATTGCRWSLRCLVYNRGRFCGASERTRKDTGFSVKAFRLEGRYSSAVREGQSARNGCGSDAAIGDDRQCPSTSPGIPFKQ